MTQRNRLAVIICTYNRSELLIRTLESMYGDAYVGEEAIDILVVANNCSDSTLSRLATFKSTHPQTRLQLNWIEEAMAGKSFALNTAIQRTHNDALCFIDDDQTVEPGFFNSLLDGLDRYPDESIFCGRLWPAWDGSEPSWVHVKDPYAIPIRPFPEFDLGNTSTLIVPLGRYPGGGNITVRRRVFAQVGKFSVELGPTGHNLAGGEDHEFLQRATQAGYAIRYLPGARQLHAIDAERMSTGYVLRKSYIRSRAAFFIHANGSGLHLYMFRKILSYSSSAVCTFDTNRRFFYLVRLAASIGELAAGLELARMPSRRRSRLPLPADRETRISAALAFVTVSCALVASFVSRREIWAGVLPTIGVAVVCTAILLAKSLSDFTQTGPRIKSDVLVPYRRYIWFSLARLCLWTLAILSFIGGGGVLVYCALNVIVGDSWSVLFGALATTFGIFVGFTLQFVRKLRFNPGLIVSSMHYRISRFFWLWEWATPMRIRLVQYTLAGAAGLTVAAASWQLLKQNRTTELVALCSAVAAYVAGIAWASWSPEPPAAPRPRAGREGMRPNILLIGSDTLRADRLGALGYRRALTPNIDALALKGTLFRNCYVPCARTAPSLVSLLTGTWPQTHGIRDNFIASADTKLKVPALPTLLKTIGYRTAVVSDWCGSDMGKFSFGFDYLDLPEDQWNIKYLIRQGPKDLRLFVSLFTHNRLGRLLLPELYYLGGVPLTSCIGRRARRIISQLARDPRPFFMNIFYSTTHPPFAAEWPWYMRLADPAYGGESKFAMAKLTDPFDIIRRQSAPKEEFDLDQIIDLYDGCVAHFDDEVGRILRHVEDCGLTGNTIIVVYSDHGMEFFEHDTWGQGNSVVGDFSARVPLVIRDPRQSSHGIIDPVIRSIDLAPTLLELIGLNPAPTMDGVSLAPCISNRLAYPELDAYNETGIWIAEMPGLPEQHLRYPDLFELLEVPDYASGALAVKPQYREIVLKAKDRMIRRGRWKLTYQPLTTGFRLQLFDVDQDAMCKVNVIDQFPEIARRLQQALLSRLAEDQCHAPIA